MIYFIPSHTLVETISQSVCIEGMDGINTEICEQFNGFLQCIKYTGSHLSQEHFMFFVQFFCTYSISRRVKNTKSRLL